MADFFSFLGAGLSATTGVAEALSRKNEAPVDPDQQRLLEAQATVERRSQRLAGYESEIAAAQTEIARLQARISELQGLANETRGTLLTAHTELRAAQNVIDAQAKAKAEAAQQAKAREEALKQRAIAEQKQQEVLRKAQLQREQEARQKAIADQQAKLLAEQRQREQDAIAQKRVEEQLQLRAQQERERKEKIAKTQKTLGPQWELLAKDAKGINIRNDFASICQDLENIMKRYVQLIRDGAAMLRGIGSADNTFAELERQVIATVRNIGWQLVAVLSTPADVQRWRMIMLNISEYVPDAEIEDFLKKLNVAVATATKRISDSTPPVEVPPSERM